jgi:hypothetical protein
VSGDQYLRHDSAWAMARAIVEIFRPVLRPEEVRDAIDEVYATVKAGLVAYEAQRDHMLKRLNPLNN